MLIVVGYYYAGPGELREISESDIYHCQEVLVQEVSAQDSAVRHDYAWLVLDRPVEHELMNVQVRTADKLLRSGEPLTFLGFGSGLPAKSDPAAEVLDPRSDSQDYFVSFADAFHGGSGGPVLDRELNLVGIQARGGDDYLWLDDRGCNTVFREAERYGQEEATYAHQALAGLCQHFPSMPACCSDDGCRSADAACNVAR